MVESGGFTETGIAETLKYIHSVKWQGSKPGLERTRELLAALGNPEKSLKFVHIAGTNGKGSTAACIASVLRQAGYRTGLYISPYILRFNERMQVDGVHITDEELVRMTDEIRPYADVMKDPPTEFELITALAMKFFLYKSCDIVVLEVGMGGELDSTNVIPSPEAAVITAIGYDHVSELGPTLTDIGKAKAGIIKGGCDVVIYGGEPEADIVFESTSTECGAKLHKTDFSRISDQKSTLDGSKFNFEPYGEIRIPFAGVYQPKNAAVAITTLEILRRKGYKIKDGDIVDGLASVIWPGRFEVLGRDPIFILDGAHNPQGFEVAAESLRRHFGERKIVFIIGVMADKDVENMANHVAPLAKEFIAVQPGYSRAMDAIVLAEKLAVFGKPATAFDSIAEGVAVAILKARTVSQTHVGNERLADCLTNQTNRAGESGIVCALGSLYFSAEIRAAYDSQATLNNIS